MSIDNKISLVVFFIALILIIAVLIRANNQTYEDLIIFKKQAIEKGYAEYNQTNGQWQWREK